MNDVQVKDVGRLGELRHRIDASAAESLEGSRSAVRAGNDVLQTLDAETARRAAAYRACDGEKQDCRALLRRWEAARAARDSFRRALTDATRSLAGQDSYVDRLRAESDRYLSGLRAHLAEVESAGAAARAAAGNGAHERAAAVAAARAEVAAVFAEDIPEGMTVAGPRPSLTRDAADRAATPLAHGPAGLALREGHLSEADRARFGPALASYVSGSDGVSGALWDDPDGAPFGPYRSLIQDLDGAVDSAPRSTSRHVTYRDTSTKILDTLGLEGKSRDEIFAKLSKEPVSFRHDGYMSTSEFRDPFKGGADRFVHLTVDVPPGSRMVDLRAASGGGTDFGIPREAEILLARGEHFIVDPTTVRYETIAGATHWYFTARMLP